MEHAPLTPQPRSAWQGKPSAYLFVRCQSCGLKRRRYDQMEALQRRRLLVCTDINAEGQTKVGVMRECFD